MFQKVLKKVLEGALRPFGYELRKRKGDAYLDISDEIKATVARCEPFTVTSHERLIALCLAAEYVAKHNIPGSFVECGVYKGGSSMAAALTFARLGRTDIDFYLYDTYEGFPAPTEVDIEAATGASAVEMFATGSVGRKGLYASPLEEVTANFGLTGYPTERVHLIKGLVEETIPASAPDSISILRLDTDWYESTKHEFVHLFPRLSKGGVIIIDDYGHWKGARQAADEYLGGEPVLLNRIDYTGRIAVKIT